MFECERPPNWLEWLRLPTKPGSTFPVESVVVEWTATGRRLAWSRADPEKTYDAYELDGTPFYARGLEASPPPWGDSWTKAVDITKDGRSVSAVWRSADGSLFLPFDPDDALHALLSEAYVDAGQPSGRRTAKALARRSYYRVRPFLPRTVQLSMRRAFSRIQRRQTFPAWPIESALHDLLDRLLQFAADVADEPLPWIAPWPQPFRWALVLTHDVETQVGYERIEEICGMEAAMGYRSSWNLVPERDYVVEDAVVQRLRTDGWEVGVHGLHHDGQDLASERMLRNRLPKIRSWAQRWDARGFRAPATQRGWDLMPLLGFEYDSSYPDTDPFEPQGGGCCSWLPFFNDDMVELPITLPQDHTLFTILGEEAATTWLTKTEAIRDRGGMALFDTHPDYLGDGGARAAYEEVLREFADDATAWRALPQDVNRWWRRRDKTRIERTSDGWRATGPAEDEVVVAFARPQAA